MIRYCIFESPLGPMLAFAGEDGLHGIYFDGQQHFPSMGPDWVEDAGAPVLRECARQLAEYFRGARRDFDLPLAPQGTAFQKRVWKEIARIPYGKTITYAALAARAGGASSARAAGAATGRNPLSIVVPCHRVMGSDGSLTGYAGGLPRKQHLLEIEGALAGSLV